jgi:hypothetical protein
VTAVVKSFGTSSQVPARPERNEARLAPLPFTLAGDPRVLVATPPKRGIWQRAVMAGRKSVSSVRQQSEMVNFLRGSLAEGSDAAHLDDRLSDPTDALDVPDLIPVIAWLTTQWTDQAKDDTLRKAAWDEYEAFRSEADERLALLTAQLLDEPEAAEPAEAAPVE